MRYKKYEEAIRLATIAHSGQLDKAGQPYILHPIRVAESVDTESEKIVAVLHDVLEDTDITLNRITEQFGVEIANSVFAITKKGKVSGGFESYRKYLDRIRMITESRNVKIADMTDNSRPERLQYLSIEKQLRLVTKYTRGRHYLLTGEWYETPELKTIIRAGVGK